MSEKTEQPTAKKLRDAREKGEVAKSKDFTQTVLIVALFSYVVATGSQLVNQFRQLILLPFSYLQQDFESALNNLLDEFFKEAVSVVLPFLMIVLVLGIFVEAMQTGMLISFKSLMPSAKKLNVAANAKNMFSKKNLIEFFKSILKIAVISWVLYALIRSHLPTLMLLPYKDIGVLGAVFAEVFKTLVIHTGLAYLVVSLADLLWQRHQYTKGLMMSKDEVKQEYKGMEGDPHIKSQRKHLYIELMQSDAVDKARQATVLVTNPTHYAIALNYQEGETPLPLVMAKGEGALAQRMIDAARAAGVPVMRNIPLAHALFDTAEVNQYIPSDLIEPVAALLRLITNLVDPQE
jgi:type III secretion protein U